ncbi:MAG TPA: sodium:proton antiporter NhaD [Pseudomonadales bacterium]|nr:sodium:proton antiporter NhaD [Pseudomonadales bacterium]
MFDLTMVLLAFIALLGVIFEEHTQVSKAKVTFMCGCLAWVLLFITSVGRHDTASVSAAFQENVGEIANLWLFLIAAMTFVAYLNKKGLIDTAIRMILPRRMSKRGLLFLTGIFCFVFSSLADNITATLVSTALILSLGMEVASTLRFAVLVVYAVNSGGVALISGDVTTLMIFLAGKVSIAHLLMLSLPSFASVMLLAALLSWGVEGEVVLDRRGTDRRGRDRDESNSDRRERRVRPVEIIIAGLFLSTIVLTMFANMFFGIPPVLCFLSGLATMFLVAHFFSEDADEDPILEYIRLVEFETLFFFLGILLIVGMLQQIGALSGIADMFARVSPLVGSYLVGLLSSLIDNVPLTAALVKANPAMTAGEWLELSYAVGVGGSLLVIGSAAGIVCMSRIKDLTVGSYARFLPLVMVAYSAGYGGAIFLAHLIG